LGVIASLRFIELCRERGKLHSSLQSVEIKIDASHIIGTLKCSAQI